MFSFAPGQQKVLSLNSNVFIQIHFFVAWLTVPGILVNQAEYYKALLWKYP